MIERLDKRWGRQVGEVRLVEDGSKTRMLEKEELEVEEIVFLRCSGVKGK
jgi:hypothetical protein